MKKKLLFLPLLAALAFAGCSNDDLTTEGGEKPGTGDLRYLAVNIVTPNESAKKPMSRASFEAGTDAENAVTSAMFVLLKNNSVVKTVTVSDLAPWSDASTDESVEKISSAVLVIDGEAEKPAVDGILAVLNPPVGLSITTDKTLTDVKGIIENYGTATSGSFVMSNSVYVDGDAVHIAETVTDANLGMTEDAAKNNPVNIYVERAVAKIKTNDLSEMTVGETDNPGNVKVNIQGETGASEENLKIAVMGVQIANCAQKSYLFKNVDDFTTTAPFDNWNDADNHRSYWAKMPSSDVTYKNYSWNQISGMGEGNTAIKDAHAFYAQENVLPYASATGHTAVIVTAQLQKQNAETSKWEGYEFVKLANQYFTPADALKQLVGYLDSRGYRVRTTTPAAAEGGESTTTYTSLDPVSSLKWRTSAPSGASNVKGWEGFAELNYTTDNAPTFVKYDPDAEGADANGYVEVTMDQINTALLDKAFRALKWTEGMCYYFVDIEHFGKETVDGEVVNRKGIIRNHIYDLNLKSLSGLGVPVFDPSKEIIPEKPGEDKLFYLAAEINILKWVLVKQDVVFN